MVFFPHNRENVELQKEENDVQLTIKEWRRVRGLTQAQLAEACECTPITLRAWENKPLQIKIGDVFKIMKALNIPSILDIIFLPTSSTNSTEKEEINE